MSTTTPPAKSARRLRESRRQACHQKPTAAEPSSTGMAHPGIEPAVDEVGRKVACERDESVHDDHAHDERVVAVDRTLDEVAPRARQPEDGFNDERSGDDECG